MPAGTPVNAHGPGWRNVERSGIDGVPFRSAFPGRRVGNEKARTRAESSSPGLAESADFAPASVHNIMTMQMAV